MLEFFADLSNLDRMMSHIREEALKIGVNEKAVHKIELACEEALVNIISYAYPDQKGMLTITCQKKNHRFEIVMKDYGLPFNPIDVEVNPQLDKPLNERKIGGLGIFLLRKFIDEVSYQRTDEENILRMAFLIYS